MEHIFSALPDHVRTLCLTRYFRVTTMRGNSFLNRFNLQVSRVTFQMYYCLHATMLWLLFCVTWPEAYTSIRVHVCECVFVWARVRSRLSTKIKAVKTYLHFGSPCDFSSLRPSRSPVRVSCNKVSSTSVHKRQERSRKACNKRIVKGLAVALVSHNIFGAALALQS